MPDIRNMHAFMQHVLMEPDASLSLLVECFGENWLTLIIAASVQGNTAESSMPYIMFMCRYHSTSLTVL